jgi:hypothetical protein
MIFPKKSAAEETAQALLKLTGVPEALAVLEKRKDPGTAWPVERVHLVTALGVCNLARTLAAEPISRGMDAETREALVEAFLVGLLKRQKTVKVKDGDDLEGHCKAVRAIVAELASFWETDPTGPGPRYYCVKEVLKRLGGTDPDYVVHDALFEMMYLCHKRYLDYFREPSIN